MGPLDLASLGPIPKDGAPISAHHWRLGHTGQAGLIHPLPRTVLDGAGDSKRRGAMFFLPENQGNAQRGFEITDGEDLPGWGWGLRTALGRVCPVGESKAMRTLLKGCPCLPT
jgi:hypothetical protein